MQDLATARHEEIENLAYRLWEKRGRPLGSPEEDWFRAEREFVERSGSPPQLPLSSLTMEPLEY